MAVINKLREAPGLRASVNPRAAQSYTRKRPDYVAQPDFRSGQWTQLSRALSQIEPKLQSFLGETHKENKKQAFAEGRAHFNANRMAWKEFAEANPELAGANPWLRRGYQEAHLDTMANQFKVEMHKFYQEEGLQNRQNPQEVQQLLGEKVKAWREENLQGFDDLDIAEFFDGKQEQYLAGLASEHSRRRMHNAVEENKQMLGQSVSSLIMGANADISINWGDPDIQVGAYQALGMEIKAKADNMIANGIPAHEANKIVIDSIVTMARDMEDEDILDLLDHIPTHDGSTVGGTNYAKNARTQTANWLEDKERRERDEQHKLFLRERQIAGIQAADNAANFFRENPTATFDQFKEAHPEIGAEHMDAIKKYRDLSVDLYSVKRPTTQTDIDAYMADRIKIANGEMDFYALTADSLRYNPKLLMDNLDFAIQRAKNKEIYDDAAVKHFRGIVGSLAGGSGALADKTLANEAMVLFDDLMVDWFEDYKKDNDGALPSKAKIRVKATTLSQEILKMDRYIDNAGDYNPKAAAAEYEAFQKQEQLNAQAQQLIAAYTAGTGMFAGLDTQAKRALLTQQAAILGLPAPVFKDEDEGGGEAPEKEQPEQATQGDYFLQYPEITY